MAGTTPGERRETAKRLRDSVVAFKTKILERNITFSTDRDAWQRYWEEHPRAHIEFGGDSLDEAMAEVAFQSWWRIYNEESQVVRFEGGGVLVVPTTVTAGEGETRVRQNALEALTLSDEDARHRVITELAKERDRLSRELRGREKRLHYIDVLCTALENGASAIRDPRTGDWIVQGMLPSPSLFDDAMITDGEEEEDNDDDAE